MSLPYFPYYVKDYEAKTAHLTMAEDGAYNRLLRLCWGTPGCSIPADEKWIMRHLRARTDEEKEAIEAVLEEFFDCKNGRYSNATQLRIFAECNEKHEKRKNAGSKGGKAKALKTKKTESSNAKAMPKQPEPEPEPELINKDTNVSLSVSPANGLSEAVSIYNDAATQSGWPQVQKITPTRSKQIRARLAECGGVEGWRIAVEKAQASDFLCARTQKPWTGFGFDWLIKSQNFTKLMEGNYDNRINSSRPAQRPENRADAAIEQIARVAGLSQASCDGWG